MGLRTLLKVGRVIGVSVGSLALLVGASLAIPPMVEAINGKAEKALDALDEKAEEKAADQAEPDPV